jgi:hypothetical protein
MGAFTSSIRWAIEPVWSSCPWVITMPRMISRCLYQVVEIGDDVIDPQHIIFREHDAAVYDQDILAVLVHHHVFSYFSQTLLKG